MEITIIAILGGFLFGLLYLNIVAKSNIFGVLFGIGLIVSGLFLFFDGIEFRDGETKTAQGIFGVNESINVTYRYSNLIQTNNGLNTTITMMMILIGIYVMFNSGFNLTGVRQRD